jgi:hypothetical protein
MTQTSATRRRSSDIDGRMEKARRELSEFESIEAEEAARQLAETRILFERKWEKFRPTLEQFLELFPQIRQVDDDWRRDVFCGREPFEPQMDQLVRGLYAVWLSYRRMFEEKAEFLGRHLHGVPDGHLDRLARFAREADRLLRAWESPVLSRGPSFRAPALSANAAARFKEIGPETK